jgi:hypothetical protein
MTRYRSATTSPGAKRPWLIESDEVIQDDFDEGDEPADPGPLAGAWCATIGAASSEVVSDDGVADPQRGHTEALSSRVAAQVGQGRTAAL